MLRDSLKENELVWTKGKIENIGDLVAISNSSAGGMSGSPLLALSGTGWKVVAMLIGGPAIIGHYHLLKLASYVDYDQPFEDTFKEYNEFNELDTDSATKGHFITILDLRNRGNAENLNRFLLFLYYEILSLTCSEVAKNKGEVEAKAMLNHNLALPIKQYIEIIDAPHSKGSMINPLRRDVIASSRSYCSCCLMF